MANERHRRHRHALKARYHRPGTSPGTYDTPGTRQSTDTSVTVVEYDQRSLNRLHRLDHLPALEADQVRWVRLKAHPPLSTLDTLKDHFHVDPMALEDVVMHAPRPKFTEFEAGYFVSVSIPSADGSEFHPLSMYLTGSTLITFFDDESVFAPIEQRLQTSSRLRQSSAYYLLYALLDLAVDLVFPQHEHVGHRLELLETELLDHPDAAFLAEAHALRRELLVLRRTAWATREVVSDLMRHWDAVTLDPLRPFLQDTYEHVVTIIDLVETQRDIATSLVEVYLSLASNRLNDVMKVLTVIATLFIPPTFLVGLYGMNFDRQAGPFNMPELGWPYGYLLVLGGIALMFVGMLIYFRRKRWF